MGGRHTQCVSLRGVKQQQNDVRSTKLRCHHTTKISEILTVSITDSLSDIESDPERKLFTELSINRIKRCRRS